MTSQLDSLKEYTVVVADTGDFESISKYKPQDSTTNPSLVLQAVTQKYHYLLDQAIHSAQEKESDPQKLIENVDDIVDELVVSIGCEILKVIPGRVSSEVDARLSFDQKATVERGKKLIQLYEKAGFSKDRVLLKIASTWEGIRAAEELEKEGIHCNLTLLFSLAQAIACAEANVTLISPFVGRILDWYKTNVGKEYTSENDPGVLSVQKIFRYYKEHGHKTVIMGASFRNKGEILELAGCDLLTISPKLLSELEACTDPVPRKLSPTDTPSADPVEKMTESVMRWQLNEDAMATEKLSEGIRKFTVDTIMLENIIINKLKAL